ncbi:S-layer homology domain-containing protein, partial [Paenibacillus sp. YN15]|uniref:S-layer homology domain-containing protein n=1 Tax=Paenibacillus sp. YN15 TaxID=1742774 RepID=UPI000DCBBF0E
FADTAGHWAEKAVRLLASRGILSGYPDGSFRPDQPLTRAETVVLLNRMLGRSGVPGEAAAMPEAAYKDLPAGHWAYAEIMSASAAS